MMRNMYWNYTLTGGSPDLSNKIPATMKRILYDKFDSTDLQIHGLNNNANMFSFADLMKTIFIDFVNLEKTRHLDKDLSAEYYETEDRTTIEALKDENSYTNVLGNYTQNISVRYKRFYTL